MNNVSEPNQDNALNPETLLDSGVHRLTFHAILAPTGGRDRIQPAGFPDVGHVIYDSPQSNGTTQKVCIVDSAASMANHLETVCHEGPFGMALHPHLNGLPYVQCVTDDNGGKNRLVVTSLSEGHRLASSLFTDTKSKVEAPGKDIHEKNLGDVLLKEKFKLEPLKKRTHPLPSDWWNVFRTIFQFDPNSLVHGILFPSMGIKIPRVLTAQLDAINAARVASSGVKFDKLLKTTSGQPIFPKDEETATEIRATFVIDLALIRSFGRDSEGLTKDQKTLSKPSEPSTPKPSDSEGLTKDQKIFLLAFALWKIARLLEHPFRYRSGCDLELKTLHLNNNLEVSIPIPQINIGEYMGNGVFSGESKDRITKIYWPKGELFKKAKDKKDTTENEDEDNEEDEETS